MALQIGDPQASIARTLTADHWLSPSPQQRRERERERERDRSNASPAGTQAEVPKTGKGSEERRTRYTPLLCPLRTTAFEVRYPPVLLPLPVPPTNFAPVVGRAQTTPQEYKRVHHSS